MHTPCTLFNITYVYLHPRIHVHVLCSMKVLGNPFDENFGSFLLNLFKEVTSLKRSLWAFPMSDYLRQV